MNELDTLDNLFQILKDYYGKSQDDSFLEYKSPKQLAALLQLDQKGTEGDNQQLLRWIEQYLQYGVKTCHPAFVNRMWTGANLPSTLGEITVAISNTSACTYESAPVSTLMEMYMIRQMLDLVGFTDGEGQMTTGSSNANMIAMMAARNLADENCKDQGLFNGRKLYAFVNLDAHYSMDKAINILGIGTDNLLKIPTNESGEMVTEELETTLRKVLDTGGLPFFVSATAGTTVRGAYDPIPPLLELRQKYGFWLHVDGAWGGAAIMSDRLREKYLTGLEETDSFTCDFHKMLGSALMCNFLLINNSKTNFSKVISGGDGSYLFRDTEDDTVPDLGNLSLQCGRRVDALKWFLDWKYYGQEGFGDRIEKYLELCEFAEQIISETPKLELVAPRTSFNVCFRYVPSSGDANTFNEKLRTDLYTEGQALVGLAYIGNTLTMRLLIVNQSVEQPHIRTFFDRVLEKGNHMESESA